MCWSATVWQQFGLLWQQFGLLFFTMSPWRDSHWASSGYGETRALLEMSWNPFIPLLLWWDFILISSSPTLRLFISTQAEEIAGSVHPHLSVSEWIPLACPLQSDRESAIQHPTTFLQHQQVQLRQGLYMPCLYSGVLLFPCYYRTVINWKLVEQRLFESTDIPHQGPKREKISWLQNVCEMCTSVKGLYSQHLLMVTNFF